jgi:DNA repair protein RadA/Sms
VKKSAKTIYCCQTCGYQTPKWMGKCPDCGTWDSIVEERAAVGSFLNGGRTLTKPQSVPVAIDSIELDKENRLLTDIQEFDRVLGGGLVPGTLVLIGGDPGIGKSTLMLQALYGLANQGHKVLYISGEESNRQIRLRSQRLDTISSELLVVSEVEIEPILAMIQSVQPRVLVIDSIQTMYNAELASAPGSVSQVRESTVRLMLMAKKTGIPTLLVGHVTKDGAIAGPKLLEHMVDTVLYFEGDRNHIFRILRAVKNRFGSTNEIGVFEMKDEGLDEVANPSAVFLSERPANAPGSAVTASMEGTRPILVELQALASSTSFMNVAGGVKVIEPAVDMAIVSAIASSFLDKPISNGTVVLGEVGLTGEVRAIGQVDARVAEAKKMGFKRCLVPDSNLKRIPDIDGVEISGIKKVSEAVDTLF